MFNRIYLEISNICNLQCTFCPVVERDKKVLEPHNFENILSQISPLTKEVCLHLMGEPLAHPHFERILEIGQAQKVLYQITTNGILLSKYKQLLLSSSSLRQINFSVQSYKDNFPNKDVNEYLDSLIDFTKECLSLRPEVYINFRLWNVGRCEEENEVVFSKLEKEFNLTINRNIQVESIKSKNLLGRLYLHFDSHFDWPSLNLPFQGSSGKCHALSTHIGIHADGTVVPCCLDKEAQIPLGNCLEVNINEILNSPRVLAMKEGFKNNQLVEKLCQHCSYINRFSR